MNQSVMIARDLTVSYTRQRPVVDHVSLDLQPGCVLGIVGESGSGKSTIALSLLGHRHVGAHITGEVILENRDVLSLGGVELRTIRGRKIAYIPQNPTTALNPSRRIGATFREFLSVHKIARDYREANALAIAALSSVSLPDPEKLLDRYPYQLSGGQQQRVVLALAISCNPPILVLDEPTTGLDVSTQKTVLELLKRLRLERDIAMVYVTHDLSLLAEIATDVAVLYAGQVVEQGKLDTVFSRPAHPYTRGLLNARPDIRDPYRVATLLKGLLRREELPVGCKFAPRCAYVRNSCKTRRQTLEAIKPGHFVACERWWDIAALASNQRKAIEAPVAGETLALSVRDLRVTYRMTGALSIISKAEIVAIPKLSLELRSGDVLAIVGESGSGKSTLAKAIAGLVPASAGAISLGESKLAFDVAYRTPEQRRRIQLVFQNPDASLNPRRRIGSILSDAVRSFEGRRPADLQERMGLALDEVKLPRNYAKRYPGQLSGGERQRVAIARALIVDPTILICDEVLSALDVSVQANILQLLRDLRSRRGLSILFISHDLSVVRSIATRIAVVYCGEIVATRPPADLLEQPMHPYLHQLLASLPGESIVPPLEPPGSVERQASDPATNLNS
jgi:peptide/nickel transport system ATP-binding protein